MSIRTISVNDLVVDDTIQSDGQKFIVTELIEPMDTYGRLVEVECVEGNVGETARWTFLPGETVDVHR